MHHSNRKAGLKSLPTPASCPMWWQTKKRHYMQVTPGCVQRNGKGWKDGHFLEYILTIILTTGNYLVLLNKYMSEGQRSLRLFHWMVQALSRGVLVKLAQQGWRMAGCSWDSWTGLWAEAAPGLSAGRELEQREEGLTLLIAVNW